MGNTKAPHHRGTHQRRAAAICAAAYANPSTCCWRCGRTLDQIRQVKPKARWTAGHLIDGQVNGELKAECSPCNYGHGAALGNRSPKRKRMWRPGWPTPTDFPTSRAW